MLIGRLADARWPTTTLRLYEHEGLLAEAAHTPAGYRDHPSDCDDTGICAAIPTPADPRV